MGELRQTPYAIAFGTSEADRAQRKDENLFPLAPNL
jgi:hypothetical protein